jgi:hypothetical protein
MEAVLESKLNMLRATEKGCDDNPTIVTLVPAFAASVTTFKSKIVLILAAVQKEKLVTSGVTIDKATAKKAICTAGAENAALVFAMASATTNEVLKQVVNFSYSDLFAIKDDELAPAIQNIHDAAQTNLVALAPYGITAPSLAIFQSVIDIYEAKVPNPKNAASVKKAVRTNLKTLFRETDLILKEQMDKTIGAFKTAHPDFVLTYKANRVIIDAKKTSAKLKGKIKSSIDGQLVKGAIVSLDNTTFTSTTNDKGQYEIKDIPFGLYTATITAPDHAIATDISTRIKQGQICRLDYVLLPR